MRVDPFFPDYFESLEAFNIEIGRIIDGAISDPRRASTTYGGRYKHLAFHRVPSIEPD